MDELPETAAPTGFARFALPAPLHATVTGLGWTQPTPIQDAAIPPLLDGRDVIGRARTGSGKTGAFALPLLARLAPEQRAPQALILTPTRELALQVADVFDALSTGSRLRFALLYGGAGYKPQLQALRGGAQCVVGTPGRVLDHLLRGTLDLSALRTLVLDEADEMLRMGFLEDVEKVLEAAPPDRQIALFSATMPEPIRRVAARFLHEPVEVQVESAALTVDHIEQRFIAVHARHKLDALVRVLRGEPHGAVLVFARTRKDCADLADALIAEGVPAEPLHGDLAQASRERVVDALRGGRIDVVVATDVAARGLDVDTITHVVNFELPGDTETYVHRIGRTGRAGRDGVALSLVAPKDAQRLRGLTRDLRVRIRQVGVPTDADIADRRDEKLLSRLRGALDDTARRTMREFGERVGLSDGDLAAAALRLLGVVPHAERSEELPDWARPHEKPPRREPPANRASATGAPGGGDEMVELFIALGGRDGVRVGDVVGCLTRGLGVPGGLVGRVAIYERKSFVALPLRVAETILAETRTVSLRGRDVPIAPSRGR